MYSFDLVYYLLSACFLTRMAILFVQSLYRHHCEEPTGPSVQAFTVGLYSSYIRSYHGSLSLAWCVLTFIFKTSIVQPRPSRVPLRETVCVCVLCERSYPSLKPCPSGRNRMCVCCVNAPIPVCTRLWHGSGLQQNQMWSRVYGA